ncbi:hypothetical protein Bca101_011322 [Brassica carinata]
MELTLELSRDEIKTYVTKCSALPNISGVWTNRLLYIKGTLFNEKTSIISFILNTPIMSHLRGVMSLYNYAHYHK